MWVLFDYARRHPRTRRYLMRAGGVTIVLVALVRLEMIFNPLHIRFEVFDNAASYGEIARVADGRPVVFRHGYAVAAKYRFYTGGEAYCQPNIRYRTHQWQFRDDDDRFAGRDFIFLPVSRGEARSAVETFRIQKGYDFPMGLDSAQSVYGLYATNFIPRNFLIDREGNVVQATIGYEPEEFDALIANIEKTLEK